ncbi:Protein of unknown function [Pyronema omphalodes CBS 100304]|uniref:Uncharacterized protein n=1 Tax=Pyronema omphalodes (strain CBS 100304) TaxID=1076935 RepID=U4LPR3_PYROM|nr:Protein of unknown function [Pyronema omphalodes CBS 100304]
MEEVLYMDPECGFHKLITLYHSLADSYRVYGRKPKRCGPISRFLLRIVRNTRKYSSVESRDLMTPGL